EYFLPGDAHAITDVGKQRRLDIPTRSRALGRTPPEYQRCAFSLAGLEIRHHRISLASAHEWPHGRIGMQWIPGHIIRPGNLRKLSNEVVVNAVMDEHAGGSITDLPRVAKDAMHCALDGVIEI